MEIELETETGCQSSKRRRSCAMDGLNSMSRFCTGFSAFEIGSAAAGLFPITVLGRLVVCRNEKQVSIISPPPSFVMQFCLKRGRKGRDFERQTFVRLSFYLLTIASTLASRNICVMVMTIHDFGCS